MTKLNKHNYVTDFADYKNIVIPKDCVGISPDAYESLCIFADERETITVESGNPIYKSIGNCLVDTTQNSVVLGCYNSIIPADGSIKTIDHHAFSGICGMESENPCRFTYIKIPQSVEQIKHHAFSDSGLTYIDLPQGLKEIGNMAFMLTSLGSDNQRITVPNTVTNFGIGVFAGCKNLKRLRFSENEIYKSESDCIYNKQTKTLLAVHCGAFAEILPCEANIIAPLTFMGQNKKAEYYIPENYTEIKVSPLGLPKIIEFPVTIVAKQGSYAHRFATEQGIDYKEWK